MSITIDLRGKTAVVTGASRGIGRGIAERFAAAGADLVLLADDAGIAEAAADVAKTHGVKAEAHRCDITDRAALTRALEGVERVDILVNNAGVGSATPIREAGEDVEARFVRSIEINLTGAYFTTRAALPKMGRGGRIIFTGSIWSKTAGPGWSAYVAAKHGVLGLMRTLAMELGPEGIAVNAICPGSVDTDANKQVPIEERRALRATFALDRPADMIVPDEIANAFLFLASDLSADVTGQALNVDRGQFVG